MCCRECRLVLGLANHLAQLPHHATWSLVRLVRLVGLAISPGTLPCVPRSSLDVPVRVNPVQEVDHQVTRKSIVWVQRLGVILRHAALSSGCRVIPPPLPVEEASQAFRTASPKPLHCYPRSCYGLLWCPVPV